MNEVEDPDTNKPLIPGVFSKVSEKPCLVRFVNCTGRCVEVIWLSFDGTPRIYKRLDPNAAFFIKTFETHPWVFRLVDSHRKCQVGGKDIFMPSPFPDSMFHNVLGPVSPLFQTLRIQYPLYSLRQRSSQVVRSLLTDVADVNSLNIPTILKAFIKKNSTVLG